MAKLSAEERRRRWPADWLRCVAALADAEGQRRVWPLGTVAGPGGSFVELLCLYFDDLGLEDGYDGAVAKALLTPAEAACATGLDEALEGYRPPNDDDLDHDAILADPAWAAVVAEAGRARGALAGLLADEAERAALTEGFAEGSR